MGDLPVEGKLLVFAALFVLSSSYFFARSIIILNIRLVIKDECMEFALILEAGLEPAILSLGGRRLIY